MAQDLTSAVIDEVIERFDFEKCQKMMAAVDWVWAIPGEDVPRLPTLKELKGCAERLLYSAASLRDCVSSGGLEARYYDSFGQAKLSLKFVGVEWSEGYTKFLRIL